MGKHPVKLREVMYTLSPFQQSVIGGLFKDMSHKVTHKVTDVSRPCIVVYNELNKLYAAFWSSAVG